MWQIREEEEQTRRVDERRAWARLVAAHIGATLAAQGQSATLARYAEEDIKSAEQALRDLGVDAHALILEAINAPNLFRASEGPSDDGQHVLGSKDVP